MKNNFNNILKICSLTLALSLGLNHPSYANSSLITYESTPFIIHVARSEWRQGQDNIAMGNRLIRKGEFDMATGRPGLGREEIQQGRDMKDLGREQVRDSRVEREWVWHGPLYRQW